jgi:hypothetical protein
MFTRYLAVCLIVFMSPTYAMPIMVDLRSDIIESLDGDVSLELDLGSRALRVSTRSGVLNRTARSFGINSVGAGDDADGIDGALGIETLIIGFSGPVELHSLSLSGFGRGDAALLRFGTSQVSVLASGELGLGNFVLDKGSELSLSHVAGNGFSLNRISFVPVEAISPTTAAAMAPAAAGLFGSGLVLIALTCGWRKNRQPTTMANFQACT